MSAQPGQMSGRAKDVRDALRSGGIAAAASLEGHYEATISAHPENNVENLEQLVDWHVLIVVGRVEQTNRGWLTADRETVVTDYDFRVEQVLKDLLPCWASAARSRAWQTLGAAAPVSWPVLPSG